MSAESTALLVMDYQVGLLARLPSAPALIAGVNAAVERQRADGGQVGWVRVGFTDADLAAMPATASMAAAVTPERRAELHADAPETQLHPDLAPLPGDASVRKVRVGAFTTTDLDVQLRERGVDTLRLAGISTSGVVLSTVREAMDRDYRIVVLSDLCADPDPEVHDFLVSRIFTRHSRVEKSH